MPDLHDAAYNIKASALRASTAARTLFSTVKKSFSSRPRQLAGTKDEPDMAQIGGEHLDLTESAPACSHPQRGSGGGDRADVQVPGHGPGLQ